MRRIVEGIPVLIEVSKGAYTADVQWWKKCSRGPFRLTGAELGPRALSVGGIVVCLREQIPRGTGPLSIAILEGRPGRLVTDAALMGQSIQIRGEWDGADGVFEGLATGISEPAVDGEAAPWLVDALEADGYPFNDECEGDAELADVIADTDASELADETHPNPLPLHSFDIQVLDIDGRFTTRIECGIAECPSPFELVGVQFADDDARVVTSLCVDGEEQLIDPLPAAMLRGVPANTFPPATRVITIDGASDRDGWHRAKATGLAVAKLPAVSESVRAALESARAVDPGAEDDRELVRRFQQASEDEDGADGVIEDPPLLLGMARAIQRREVVRVPLTVVTRGGRFTVRIQCGEDDCPAPFRLVSVDLGRGPSEVTSLRVAYDEQLLDGGTVTAEFLREASPGDLQFPAVGTAQVIEIAGTSAADDGYHSGEAFGETLVDGD